MPHEIAAPLAEENLGLVHLCANRFRGVGWSTRNCIPPAVWDF